MIQTTQRICPSQSNAATRDLDERIDGHTVLVHVRRRNGDGYEERHASWPAEQVGRTVIGPPQFC